MYTPKYIYAYIHTCIHIQYTIHYSATIQLRLNDHAPTLLCVSFCYVVMSALNTNDNNNTNNDNDNQEAAYQASSDPAWIRTYRRRHGQFCHPRVFAAQGSGVRPLAN